MCSLKSDRENYFYKLVQGLNLVKKKKLYISYSAHFGTHIFFNQVYTVRSCPVLLTTTKVVRKFLCFKS